MPLASITRVNYGSSLWTFRNIEVGKKMYVHGWYKVAFEYELENPLTAAAIGDIRLVLVRSEGGIRAYKADCPHRGAHLAYGGKLNNASIICPFHGYRIGLGKESDD